MRRYYRGKKISKGEMKISQFLDSHNIEYTREQTFKECVNSNGNLLRFDFYLEKYNLLIEYQGNHHYGPVNKHKRAKRVYESTVIHDAIKDSFAYQNKINLIKIHHKDYKKVEEILIELFVNDIKDLSPFVV